MRALDQRGVQWHDRANLGAAMQFSSVDGSAIAQNLASAISPMAYGRRHPNSASRPAADRLPVQSKTDGVGPIHVPLSRSAQPNHLRLARYSWPWTPRARRNHQQKRPPIAASMRYAQRPTIIASALSAAASSSITTCPISSPSSRPRPTSSAAILPISSSRL